MTNPTCTRLMSIDPGKTTGIVTATRQSGRQFKVEQSFLHKWDDRYKIGDLLDLWKPHVVICESFRLYEHRAKAQIGNDFPSAQYIGMLNYLLDVYYPHEVELVMQSASQVKSSTKIQPEHKHALLKSPHVRDAYHHLRYYILVNNPSNK